MAAKDDLIAQRRSLIDLVAETRSRSIRIALFGSLLHRPDPDGQETEEDRASNLRVLADTANWIERVNIILGTGNDPWNKIPGEHCAWLFQYALGMPNTPKQVRGMSLLSKKVAEAAEHKPDDLGEALRLHYEFRRSGFMDAVTDFCDAVWASIDDERLEAVSRANEAGSAIQSTLGRLERIGKHVRLVALNASVEASRLGETGQGIGTIAREFKTLSEEIQSLAINASAEMSKITTE